MGDKNTKPRNKHGPRILSVPGVLGGKPVIEGTRIPVQVLLQNLRDGWTIAELLEDYPQLTPMRLDAALEYAIKAMGEPPSTEARSHETEKTAD